MVGIVWKLEFGHVAVADACELLEAFGSRQSNPRGLDEKVERNN
jgi:hypothetical protein